jgi:hypothetical protein
MTREEFLNGLARRLADEGKLVEAGWLALQALAVPADAPLAQIKQMRMAYMAGAQHLFASIMGLLDPEDEPTEADMRRLDLINTELEAFGEELKASLNN